MARAILLLASVFLCQVLVDAWVASDIRWRRIRQGFLRRTAVGLTQRQNEPDLQSLKIELHKYLEARRKAIAESCGLGKTEQVVGGTKGNFVLEYVGAVPNKEQVIETDPDDVFDYLELEKYGFRNLTTPIMEAGGRLAMYELMDIPIPPMKVVSEPEVASEIVIDKRGVTDASRYKGLKLGLLDDSAMAEALQNAQIKEKEGIPLRAPIAEELYVPSYKNKRNVGPRMTPDWTPERIDDELSRQGDAISWARKARADRLMRDSSESLDLEVLQQLHSVITATLIAVSFGKATPTFLSSFGMTTTDGLLDSLKIPTTVLCIVSVASAALCGIKASEKRRSPILWTIKGLLGGILTLQQLNGLPDLMTRAEFEQSRRNNEP